MKEKFLFFDNRAMIQDYMFYTDNMNDIDDWLWLNNSSREGMIITFADEQVRTMFMLKWA